MLYFLDKDENYENLVLSSSADGDYMSTPASAKQTRGSTNSFLSGLRFSATMKPSKAQEQHRSPRQVVNEFIDQQIALATADLEGKNFSLKKFRFKKDETGKSHKTEVQVVPRRAFWQNGSEWLASVKYGNMVVELSPQHPSFFAGSTLHDVINAFAVVRKAVEAGEADTAIEAAMRKSKRKVALAV